DGLRVKSEGIGLQSIYGRYRNAVRTLLRRWLGLWARHWMREARIVEDPHKSLQPKVPRQSPADRIEAKQETRSHRGGSRVAPGAGDEHFWSTERASEIMRGETDPELEAWHFELRPNLRRQPRIGRCQRGPYSLVHPP